MLQTFLIFWIDNLTTFTTSHSKLKTSLPIAHSLSYNILKSGRKWSYNNQDTAQRSLPCRFMFGKTRWPPIDITRKYEKLCIVAFNWKFDYDDVTKLYKLMSCDLVENCLSYNISKSGRKSMTGKRDNEGHYDVINENFDARARARCDAHGNVDC